MATRPRTISEYIEIYRNQVQSSAGDLTDFAAGSLHDIISGGFGIALNEISEFLIDRYRKTNFDTATGQDLEDLAIDHYGPLFARPSGAACEVVLRFSRPNSNAGAVTIPAGTDISTRLDSLGESVTFSLTEDVVFADTALSATGEARAEEPGASGNVGANTLVDIGIALTDPTVTVTNPVQAAGGTNPETDEEYRITIRNLLSQFVGATVAAIRGVVSAAPSVAQAVLVEALEAVIPYDLASQAPKTGRDWFYYIRPVVYVADANGRSGPSVVRAAEEAADRVRACGVRIEIIGARVIQLTWEATATLNPSGPNFAELSADKGRIIDVMTGYVNNDLDIGTGFDVSVANAAILARLGPSGTRDITAFATTAPTLDVSGEVGAKIVLDRANARVT